MRWVVLVGAALLATAAAGNAAASSRPTLVLSGHDPLVVRGAHFTPSSLVRVLVSGTKPTLTKVKTTRLGTFTLPLAGGVDRCSGLSVQAIGAHGERASAGIGVAGCSNAGVGDVSK